MDLEHKRPGISSSADFRKSAECESGFSSTDTFQPAPLSLSIFIYLFDVPNVPPPESKYVPIVIRNGDKRVCAKWVLKVL